MKTRAAVVHELGQPCSIEELELKAPGQGEVVVRYLYSGICYSDVHIIRGDLGGRLPIVPGHEGSGIVEEVGIGVDRVKVGDHVVMNFIPSCGTCRWCATGQQAICDNGASILDGYLPSGEYPLSGRRGLYGAQSGTGTHSQYGLVHQNSVVPIDPDFPMDLAALVGCGVPTGWGSAVYAADVRPGDAVAVYGVGGIGIHAVQGAKFAGAEHLVAVDPVASKRAMALKLGATQSVATAEEAEELTKQLTRGVGVDKAIIAVNEMTPEVVSAGFEAVSKAGTVVLVGLSVFDTKTIQLPGTVMTLYKKVVRGSLYGDCNPTRDIPKLIRLYQSGHLRLDELITRRYSLAEFNQGIADLLAGDNMRGIIQH